MSAATNLEDTECKAPFAIVVPFWRPDITTSTTENLCDNMSDSGFAETPRDTDDEGLVSRYAETCQETKETTEERFHHIQTVSNI